MHAEWTNFGSVVTQQPLHALEGIGIDERGLFAFGFRLCSVLC